MSHVLAMAFGVLEVECSLSFADDLEKCGFAKTSVVRARRTFELCATEAEHVYDPIFQQQPLRRPLGVFLQAQESQAHTANTGSENRAWARIISRMAAPNKQGKMVSQSTMPSRRGTLC